jgi:hypothetical protein
VPQCTDRGGPSPRPKRPPCGSSFTRTGLQPSLAATAIPFLCHLSYDGTGYTSHRTTQSPQLFALATRRLPPSHIACAHAPQRTIAGTSGDISFALLPQRCERRRLEIPHNRSRNKQVTHALVHLRHDRQPLVFPTPAPAFALS